ncbi:DUF6412 domain-containing protein [Kibdelosporangium phytohabitans]|uniref:Uncharacterized protein n=1 Tax=Kibdelosporangium phytohabitans TaxID=860235 RepID=A0A0N9I561_9PSEU|nr:DUF6412 domain-containing protein [Kibdelosporangium phytohabitans]ALG11229.1 hypothetical protein AOZ06_34010 [Kibdelosporangium phytohabitans]MBE1462505.1 hypothetical protein [Kibdelosporangium phytohabitans]
MLRLQLLLAVFLPVAFVLLTVDTLVPAALATALTAGMALLLTIRVALPAPTSAPAGVRAVSLRERARRSVCLRLRDPDASGRPRPRAPGAAPAAA